ncbi:MAG: hypothetical protein QOF58_7586 [Pseudonocardiales bacterium]|jgi:hypothetical protein|nr:hypothetical protein [Pseudonocardiales bacterium]
MTALEELLAAKDVSRPGGTGMWAPVIPPRRGDEEWVVQADEDPAIVRGVD